jgi:hypothetical protein
MLRASTVCCAAVLACLSLLYPTSSVADFKNIDRGGGASGGAYRYWIYFVARDYVPGHAFVIVGVADSKNSTWISREGYGFYPKDASKVILGTIPGHILEENTKGLRSASNGLAVAVTKQMHDYVLTNMRAMKRGELPYNLIAENCVTFANLAAQAIGLNAPTPSGYHKHPQGFIYALRDRNN